MGLVLPEIGHADIFQVALVDHVVSGNGIAEKHIRLIECHRIQRILVRRVGADQSLGVQLLHFVQWQVVIDQA